jgi:predicted GH43/DUF377 family glycosyl hydrolase
MIRRLSNACICRPGDLRASRDDLEIIGTFNPGAIAIGDEVIVLVRVAERLRERRAGHTALPRWQSGAGLNVDWIANEEFDLLDARVVRRKRDGLVRLTSVSHLRILRSCDGRSIDREGAARFEPQSEFEEFGIEDPRITRIGDTYWFTYVAVSRHGPATALASTKDFATFTRHGVIFPIENKDVVLFPETIDGEYVALHRPVGGTPFTQPEIWLARSSDMVHWGRHMRSCLGVIPDGMPVGSARAHHPFVRQMAGLNSTTAAPDQPATAALERTPPGRFCSTCMSRIASYASHRSRFSYRKLTSNGAGLCRMWYSLLAWLIEEKPCSSITVPPTPRARSSNLSNGRNSGGRPIVSARIG